MSDFLVIRGFDADATRPLLEAWKAARRWVRSVEVRDALEPHELFINGRQAMAYLKGKHKAELADLIALIQRKGGRVVHVMLHRGAAERAEVDLAEWASRHRTDPPHE